MVGLAAAAEASGFAVPVTKGATAEAQYDYKPVKPVKPAEPTEVQGGQVRGRPRRGLRRGAVSGHCGARSGGERRVTSPLPPP